MPSQIISPRCKGELIFIGLKPAYLSFVETLRLHVRFFNIYSNKLNSRNFPTFAIVFKKRKSNLQFRRKVSCFLGWTKWWFRGGICFRKFSLRAKDFLHIEQKLFFFLGCFLLVLGITFSVASGIRKTTGRLNVPSPWKVNIPRF